jgi:hypothetical protein
MEVNIADASLTAVIELHSTDPPAGAVVIENHSNDAVRIWRRGNSWGDEALSFELSASEQTTRITTAGQDYTRNVPASLTVTPGARREISFDLGDGTWQPASALAHLRDACARIVAIYESGDSPQVQEQGIWRGNIRSAPIPLHCKA